MTRVILGVVLMLVACGDSIQASSNVASCSSFQGWHDAATTRPPFIVRTDTRTEIDYAPFQALWGNVFPLNSNGHYIGMFAPEAYELHGEDKSVRRGTVLIVGDDQCEWFDAIN